LDKGGDARGRRPDDDGDGAAVGLPVRLRVPAGFDATGVRVGGAVPADDLADRRLAGRDPAWGRLVGPVAACGSPVGDGHSVPGFQLVQGAEAALLSQCRNSMKFFGAPREPSGGRQRLVKCTRQCESLDRQTTGCMMLAMDGYPLWEVKKAGLYAGKWAKGLPAHPPRW